MPEGAATLIVVLETTTAQEDTMTTDISRVLTAVYDEAINKGNLDAVDDVLDPEYVEHGALGDFTGPEGFKGLLRQWRQAFPDMHCSYSDVIQDGDRAAWRSTMTGTHLGDLPGIPATGKRVELETFDMGTARDGRALEHRSVMDRLAMLEQLGLVPAPEGAAASA
jgi:predicted ester cyclase